MFEIIKDLHNLVRWVVVLFGLWAVARAWWGLLVRREWRKWDRLAGMLFSSSLDVQLLLGVILSGAGAAPAGHPLALVGSGMTVAARVFDPIDL
jgi:hypothetical protein